MYIAAVCVHFLFDWILQPRWMAEQKSSNIIVLLAHCMLQFAAGVILLLLFHYLYTPEWAKEASDHYNVILAISGINALAHAVIDWSIWRFYKFFVSLRLLRESVKTNKSVSLLRKEFADKRTFTDDYWFYTTIALDQMLHLIILFSCIEYYINTISKVIVLS